MADLHSWQPSHLLIIRGGESRQDGREEEAKERWRVRDCKDMGEESVFAFMFASVYVNLFVTIKSLEWSNGKILFFTF